MLSAPFIVKRQEEFTPVSLGKLGPRSWLTTFNSLSLSLEEKVVLCSEEGWVVVAATTCGYIGVR
jgi:hypothetical protein